MQFCSLVSGSQGNSFLVRHHNSCILIDCGFGLAETEKRLERHQVNPKDINAILLTHEHEDHVDRISEVTNGLIQSEESFPCESCEKAFDNLDELDDHYADTAHYILD